MAILTLAEFKASATYLLNASLFGTDAITSQLCLDAEDSYLDVRNKPFKKITGSYTDTEYTITGIGDYDMIGLKVGQRVGGTSARGEITDIGTNTITIDTPVTATVADDEMFIYPENSLNTAIRIVKYLRSAYQTDQGKKSESIEKHSWTNYGQEELVNGLPKSIANSIKRCVSVKEGQKTGKGYYQGRQEISDNDVDVTVHNTDVEVTN